MSQCVYVFVCVRGFVLVNDYAQALYIYTAYSCRILAIGKCFVLQKKWLDKIKPDLICLTNDLSIAQDFF